MCTIFIKILYFKYFLVVKVLENVSCQPFLRRNLSGCLNALNKQTAGIVCLGTVNIRNGAFDGAALIWQILKIETLSSFVYVLNKTRINAKYLRKTNKKTYKNLIEYIKRRSFYGKIPLKKWRFDNLRNTCR